MKRSAQQRDRWTTQLPEQPEALWYWLRTRTTDTLVALLAYCVSCTVKPMREPCADQIATAFSLDMAQWWQPTVPGYLGRVSKTLICEAVTEAKGKRRRTTSPRSRKATWPNVPPNCSRAPAGFPPCCGPRSTGGRYRLRPCAGAGDRGQRQPRRGRLAVLRASQRAGAANHNPGRCAALGRSENCGLLPTSPPPR